MQQETKWRLPMQIRINQIVKTEFLLQYSLNLNGFHIITADQSYTPPSCNLILAHLSRRLICELSRIPMVRRPSSSSVRPQYQTSSSWKPLDQSGQGCIPNFMGSLYHMTKMAAMLIYGKNF